MLPLSRSGNDVNAFYPKDDFADALSVIAIDLSKSQVLRP
jgi:hypothetical protein|tara:strand:- start:565 stop:684 length:120 start_codon:yes stop_codon:yes gene_type:complete